MPLARNQFDLSAQGFRGDLALQYKQPLTWKPQSYNPQSCDGCGGDFGIEHALSCRFGTLVTDLCVQGVWIPQTEALFDICVVDSDTQSYHRYNKYSKQMSTNTI